MNRARSHLDHLSVGLGVLLKVFEPEAVGPVLLAQIEEHRLFQLRLAVGDGERVVVPVQAMDEGLQSV